MDRVKVIVVCESSGVVRDAFRAKGHDAVSCDLLPSERPGPHIMGDVRDLELAKYDLMIAHPPCTYLCSSGLHWNKRRPDRARKTEEALEFVAWLFGAPVKRKAIENPIGCISTRLKKPSQIVQPHEFGDDASKATCLWLFGLPPLLSTAIPSGVGRVIRGKERWENQTDSGQNKLAPSADRWKERSRTYPGLADAMADQWSAMLSVAAA